MSVTVRAPAKVNLSLLVGAVREDGYHALDTVYQAISLYDDVRVTEATEWSLTLTPLGGVDVSEVPLDGTNLALRAGTALLDLHGLDRAAHVEIGKGIPVAGGLAGGSADAAATLVALDRLWDLGTSDEDLLALAARLGSDVPFSLVGGSAHGTGRGELVEPLDDRGSWWWLVVPSTDGLSTPAVYAELDRLRAVDGPGPDAAPDTAPDAGSAAAALVAGDVAALAGALRNDLQAAAVSLRPDLAGRLEQLLEHGCRAALLSGSGPTVLGLVHDQDEALEARTALLASGLPVVHVATAPVAGVHVVEYV